MSFQKNCPESHRGQRAKAAGDAKKREAERSHQGNNDHGQGGKAKGNDQGHTQTQTAARNNLEQHEFQIVAN